MTRDRWKMHEWNKRGRPQVVINDADFQTETFGRVCEALMLTFLKQFHVKMNGEINWAYVVMFVIHVIISTVASPAAVTWTSDDDTSENTRKEAIQALSYLGIIICSVYYDKNGLLTMKPLVPRISNYFTMSSNLCLVLIATTCSGENDTTSIQGHVQFTRLGSAEAWRTSYRLKWWAASSSGAWIRKEFGLRSVFAQRKATDENHRRAANWERGRFLY